MTAKFKRLLQKARIIDIVPADDEKEVESAPPVYLHLSLETAPFCAVLLLLASTIIDRHVMHDALAGSNGMRPYDVMSLFIVLVRIISTSHIVFPIFPLIYFYYVEF